MLSGIKFIPKDELEQLVEESDDRGGKTRVTRALKKMENSPSTSSDGDDREILSRRRHRRRKHISDDDSSVMTSSLEENERSGKRISRIRRKKKKFLISDDPSSSSNHGSSVVKKRSKKLKSQNKRGHVKENSDDATDSIPFKDNEVVRKNIGLEWMLSSGSRPAKDQVQVEEKPAECEVQENATNPRELNPYLKDNGSGYPDYNMLDADPNKDKLLSSSVVGDGGASWRLKALKRAKERAAREGLNFAEVVEERWGSVVGLASSVAGQRAANARAHLHAIKDRKSEHSEKSEMRTPSSNSLSWKKGSGNRVKPSNDTFIINEAFSSLNKFANDGSFMDGFVRNTNKTEDFTYDYVHGNEPVDRKENKLPPSTSKDIDDASSVFRGPCSSNQLAAKVLQLRMKGKHKEAEKLLADMNTMSVDQDGGSRVDAHENKESMSRFTENKITRDRMKKEDDFNLNLAQEIIRNRKYSLSASVEDEYDDQPSGRKHKKRKFPTQKSSSKYIATQKERCQFCFENPSRPKHLIISLANYTYMMVPPWPSLVQGHCCILPMQHDSSTRMVDNDVWEEFRNFKKCLIKMFAKKERNVVFLETVINLSQQRRHCLIECVPIPHDLAEEAPMYFKKAIDEAEEEWGQHEMKKLIPTSGNLRHVIPENFSYFHIEFGLDRGFVHIIEDDSNFGSSFGLNVLRGLLHLPEEDMYRRSRRREPEEMQKQAVAGFLKDWEPFDWTRQLD